MDASSQRAGRAVAIFRSPLFNASETFVMSHVAGLRRYRPILVGLVRKTGDPPPGVPLLLPESLAERLSFAWAGRGSGLARRLALERPALIHAHFGTDGLLALPLARQLGVPLVTTLHGFEVSRRFVPMLASGRASWIRYALLKRRLFEQGALFVAVSDAVGARALRMGCPRDRLVTLHNGVDVDSFTPAPEAAERGLILHVGRLVEKKGTRLLVDALPSLPAARLVILGDGPRRRALEDRADRLGVRDRVDFLGERPPAEVAGWMRRAWLLAVPSVTARDGDSEGLPTVICEAAAIGLPVVASDHSGNGEAVDDGGSGFLVPEGDVAALASRIGELLADALLRERMSGRARRIAEERFSLSRQIERLEAHYDALATCA